MPTAKAPGVFLVVCFLAGSVLPGCSQTPQPIPGHDNLQALAVLYGRYRQRAEVVGDYPNGLGGVVMFGHLAPPPLNYTGSPANGFDTSDTMNGSRPVHDKPSRPSARARRAAEDRRLSDEVAVHV